MKAIRYGSNVMKWNTVRIHHENTGGKKMEIPLYKFYKSSVLFANVSYDILATDNSE